MNLRLKLIIFISIILLSYGFKFTSVYNNQLHTKAEIISESGFTIVKSDNNLNLTAPETNLRITKTGIENVASNILVVKFKDGSWDSNIIPAKIYSDIIKLESPTLKIDRNSNISSIIWIVALYGKQTPYHTSKVELINRTYTLEELRERT